MELDEAMAELPTAYAQALRLHGNGATNLDIATRLDIPLASVDTLVKLAEAKLTALLARPPRTP
jgi:DNA-directed RNA polymerase specialized sigma24 family protein